MKVFIVDPVHPVLMEKLEQAGFAPDYQPRIEAGEIGKKIPHYQGIVVRSKVKVDHGLIDRGGHLKFIARVGSGMENIDRRYAESKGIVCLNSPEGNRDAVGEHALGLLLSLINQIPRANGHVKGGQWDREAHRGMEIKGRTLGLIGYGHTGSAFAGKLAGLGVNTIAWDKYKFDYSSQVVKEKALSGLFDEADVLSLHVPLTTETHYMVNDAFLRQFRKPLILINTSRGAVVNTADLVKNLKSGQVKAAALDVLEYESSDFEGLHQSGKLPQHFRELSEMPQVILTPHVAGWTHESYYKLSAIIANKIIRHWG